VLAGVDDPRRGMILPAQGFGRKARGRRYIPFGREKEVDRRTGRVHRPVQVHPFAFDPDVRLVHPPRVRCCLEPFEQDKPPRAYRRQLVQWICCNFAVTPVAGWPDDPPGVFSLRFIQMASIRAGGHPHGSGIVFAVLAFVPRRREVARRAWTLGGITSPSGAGSSGTPRSWIGAYLFHAGHQLLARNRYLHAWSTRWAAFP
jgi:hypothetical protein